MEKIFKAKRDERCTLDNSLFSPFLKENGFIGVPRFVLLDKNGCIMWRNAKRPSDADLQKELDLLFK